jgi:choline transporter-like protein 2/4/5
MEPGTEEHAQELENHKDHEHNQEVDHDLSIDPLPVKKRGCTDILCTVLLLANWGAMSFVGFGALGWVDTYEATNGKLYVDDGHPELLYRGVDHNGYTCGVSLSDQDQLDSFTATDYTDSAEEVDAAFADRNYLYYPNMFGVIGVSSGPDAGSYLGTDYAICVSACPTDTSTSVTDITTGDKWTTSIEQTRFISWCFPTTIYDSMVLSLEEYTSVIMQVVQDLGEVYHVVLVCGIGIPIVAIPCYLYLLESTWLLPIAVWSCIYGLVGTLVGLGGWLAYYSGIQATEELENMYLYGGYASAVFGGLLFVVCLCKRKQIDLAIGILEEAAHAIIDCAGALLFVLFIQLVCMVLFLTPFVTYCLYLASGGDQASSGTTPSYTVTTYPDEYNWICLYMVFTFFWSVNFFHDVGTIGISSIISQWYFHPQGGVEVTVTSPIKGEERASRGISNGELSLGALRCMVLHAGTAAVGSFIIAVVQTIRVIVAYAQKKAKQSGSKLAQYLLCALQCFVWCLEKCLKFINKHAYIQTAVFGTGFITSTYRAFFLILRNMFTVSVQCFICFGC